MTLPLGFGQTHLHDENTRSRYSYVHTVRLLKENLIFITVLLETDQIKKVKMKRYKQTISI